MAILRFEEWALHEAARRSFSRTLDKYGPQVVDKPVATLTAWRGELLDPSGTPYPEATRRKLNDEANRKLVANLKRRGLSSFPVVGAGPEADKLGHITVNKENSVIVQPVGDMVEQEFVDHIRQLLFNPTGERGLGPFRHTQWGALVKLPSFPEAFLMYQSVSKKGVLALRHGHTTSLSDRPDRRPVGPGPTLHPGPQARRPPRQICQARGHQRHSLPGPIRLPVADAAA